MTAPTPARETRIPINMPKLAMMKAIAAEMNAISIT
jgi:hypothetical protein